MTKKIKIHRVEKEEKQVGWVEVSGPEDIEWDFDREDPAYPEFKKILRRIETGEANYPKSLEAVPGEEEKFSDGVFTEDFAEPTVGDVCYYISGSNPDRNLYFEYVDE